jgi:hypothetical protein
VVSLRVLLVLSLVGAAVATPAAEAAHLALAWDDTSFNELGFVVERRVASLPTYAAVATVGSDMTGYLDQNLPAGVTYCYRVRAFNNAGMSGYTAEECATTTAGMPSTPPLSVSLNSATLASSATMVAVVNAVGGHVTSAVDAYIVLDAGAGGFFSLLTDGSLVPGVIPIARGIVLETASVPFVFPLAGAPPGHYVWMAALTAPGSLALVSPVVSTPFTVLP